MTAPTSGEFPEYHVLTKRHRPHYQSIHVKGWLPANVVWWHGHLTGRGRTLPQAFTATASSAGHGSWYVRHWLPHTLCAPHLLFWLMVRALYVLCNQMMSLTVNLLRQQSLEQNIPRVFAFVLAPLSLLGVMSKQNTPLSCQVCESTASVETAPRTRDCWPCFLLYISGVYWFFDGCHTRDTLSLTLPQVA